MKSNKTKVLLFLLAISAAGVMALVFIPFGKAFKELNLNSYVYKAIKAGDAAEVEKLMQRGANPNRFGAGGLVGGTPVTWAIAKSDVKILNVLIQHGADVNRDDDGWTPLDCAASVNKRNIEQHKETRDSLQVIELLKQAGGKQKAGIQATAPSNGKEPPQLMEGNGLSTRNRRNKFPR